MSHLLHLLPLLLPLACPLGMLAMMAAPALLRRRHHRVTRRATATEAGAAR